MINLLLYFLVTVGALTTSVAVVLLLLRAFVTFVARMQLRRQARLAALTPTQPQ